MKHVLPFFATMAAALAVYLALIALYKGYTVITFHGICPQQPPDLPARACTREELVRNLFDPFEIVALTLLAVPWLVVWAAGFVIAKVLMHRRT